MPSLFERLFTFSEDELNVAPLDPAFKGRMKTTQGPVTLDAHRAGTGVHVLVGEGATLTGLAKFFIDALDPKPAWANPPSMVSCVRVAGYLFLWAAGVFKDEGVTLTTSDIPRLWLTGTIFPLPALLTTDLQGVSSLQVDLARLDDVAAADGIPHATRTLAASLRAFNPFDKPIPYRGPWNFDALTPQAVVTARDQVETEFNAAVQKETVKWTNRLRWNPYAALFPIAHLIFSLDDANGKALVGALFAENNAAITPHELDRIASTSAGAMLLRAAFPKTLVGSGPRKVVAAALKCATDADLEGSDIRWRDPTLGADARFPDHEPPAPSTANADTRKNDALFVSLFLGREVTMRWIGYAQNDTTNYAGASDAGSIFPDNYLTTKSDLWPALDPRRKLFKAGSTTTDLNTEQLDDRRAVITAIIDIEGYADAVRAADMALISFGMQQFSFHVDDEGTVVFRRFRQLSNGWFDMFFRSAGFDVDKRPSTADQDVGSYTRPKVPAIGAAIDLDSPAWLIRLGAPGKAQWCVPGTVRNDKNGDPMYPPVDGEPGQFHTDCRAAFGYKGNTATRQTEALLLRWAVAARMVPEVIQAQVEASIHRFTRLQAAATAKASSLPHVGTVNANLTTWDYLFDDAADKPTFEQVLAAPVVAAAVIDCFINTPVHTLPTLRRAYQRAATSMQSEAGWSGHVDTTSSTFRAHLLVSFLSERRFFTLGPRVVFNGTPTASQWYANSGAVNNVAKDRVANLLDRADESTPYAVPSGGPRRAFGPRPLKWTGKFNW